MHSSHWLRRVTLVTLFALPCTVITAVRAQQPPPAGGQRGAQTPAAPTGPLAPTVYKNIQVLTDVQADQLDLAMQFVSASVGMPCLNCHVQDATTGEWAYDKDDKRAKQTSRTMMKMVYAIRAGGFGVNANCATCHNGKNRPPGLPLIESMTTEQMAAATAAAAAAAARQGGAAGAPPAGAPPAGGAAPGGGRGQQGPAGPAVDDVLAKYITALGGQAAVEKLKSRVMSGTLTTRGGQNVAFTIEEKAGGKYRETQTTPSQTTMTRAVNGTSGWTQVANGKTSDLSGFGLQQAQRAVEIALPLELKTRYANLTPGRSTRIGDVDVNLIQNVAPEGITDRFFFDATSGLLVRHSTTTRTPMGNLPEQVDYSDYKDVAGVKTPFTIKRTNWGALDTLKIVDVKPNAQIADTRFTKPG